MACPCNSKDAEGLQAEATTNTRVMVDISAWGSWCEEVEAILDGGSSYSFISYALARAIKPKTDTKKRIRFKGVGGIVSTSLGAASLVIKLAGKKIRYSGFHVAPEPPVGADPGWSIG